MPWCLSASVSLCLSTVSHHRGVAWTPYGPNGCRRTIRARMNGSNDKKRASGPRQTGGALRKKSPKNRRAKKRREVRRRVRPSEFSVPLLARKRLHPRASSRDRHLVQSLGSPSYRPIGSTIPLYRWTIYPGCVVFLGRVSLVAVRLPVDSSLRVCFPPEYYPASPSRQAATHQPLSWTFAPFSTSGIEGPLCRGLSLPTAFRPQGLVTLSTASSLRIRAGFISHRRRSWDSPFGAFSSRKAARAFPHGAAHLPFLPQVEPPTGAGGRPCRPRFLGFSSRESLATGRGFSTPTAGGSPGFLPFRVRSRRPGPGFRPTSSHALRRGVVSHVRAGAPESRSAAACLRSSPRMQAHEGVRRDPSRVFAPVQSRHWNPLASLAIFSPHTASCITVDRPVIFETCLGSDRGCRDCLRCLALATSASQILLSTGIRVRQTDSGDLRHFTGRTS